MSEESDTPPWLSFAPDEVVHYDERPSYITVLPAAVFDLVIIAVSVIAWVYVGGNSLAVLSPGLPDVTVPGYVFSVGILYGVLRPLVSFLPLYFKRYVLTSQRIVIKEGILSTDTQSQRHENVQEVRMNRSLTEKALRAVGIADIADFSIASAGTDTREMRLRNVRDPDAFESRRMEAMG